MRNVKLGSTGLQSSQIGLGCSRIGSILGASRKQASILLEEAITLGITYFDTSDLYGQGNSERLLGRHVVGRPGVIIASKIGKRHPLGMRILSPIKGPIQTLLRSSASGALRAVRSKQVPTCFEPRYLRRAIDRTLRRLRLETVDILMLHSPSAEIVRRGDAIHILELAKQSGKIRTIGASVDNIEVGQAVLADARIQALQIPLRFGDSHFHPLASAARSMGVAVIAREIFGGPRTAFVDLASVKATIRNVTALPGVSVTLVGTTQSVHLRDAVRALDPWSAE